ncbi:hypothetical protein D3C72_2511800 [compost metagenome]
MPFRVTDGVPSRYNSRSSVTPTAPWLPGRCSSDEYRWLAPKDMGSVRKPRNSAEFLLNSPG